MKVYAKVFNDKNLSQTSLAMWEVEGVSISEAIQTVREVYGLKTAALVLIEKDNDSEPIAA